MGDIIHTLPAVTDASRIIPDISFDWVIEENFAQIPNWHAYIDQVIPVALRRWRKSPFSQTTRCEWHQFKQKLSQYPYDLVIDAQGLLKSAFITMQVSTSQKHGYDWTSAREPLASLFYQNKHTVTKQLHAVERTRHLFASSLGYPLPQSRGDYAIAQHFTQTVNFTQTANSVVEAPYLVFLHATTRDTKHWPETYWRELIGRLENSPFVIKLPWGAQHEQERAYRLAQGYQHVQVLPKLTLEKVAFELANAEGIVSVDTGLSHLAAALDKRNITIYGPTDPGLIGGYGKSQHYLCASAYGSKDMAVITPEMVLSYLFPDNNASCDNRI
jgi:heptosyltransferase-1